MPPLFTGPQLGVTFLSTCAEVGVIALHPVRDASVVLLSTLSTLFAEPGAGKA